MKKLIISFLITITVTIYGFSQKDTTIKVIDTTHTGSYGKDTVITKNKADTTKYALLYVYRPKNFVGMAIGYDLKITNSSKNGYIIGRVQNNSKFVYKIFEEGKTEVWGQTEAKESIFVEVKYGQKYYVKCGISMGVMVGRPDLNLIDKSQGEYEYSLVKERKR